MTLYGLLERHLLGGPARPLLVTSDVTYTSSDLDRESAKVAAWLRASGLARGDRVAVDLKNGMGAVAALFGVARAGGVVVGTSPQWTVPQFEHVLRDSGASILVTGDLRAKQLGERRPPHVLVDGPADGLESTTPWHALTETWDGQVLCAPDEPAILIYTSGSTGRPKGVIHSHQNLEDFARIVAGYLENTEADRLMWLLGWSYGYGLSQLLTMCFVGGRVVVPSSMMPVDVVDAYEAHAITGLAQVPFGWEQLLAFLSKTGKTMPGVRYVTNAGDGPSLSLVERLPRAFPGAQIVLMYGQTECFRSTFLPPDQVARKPGAMGYAIPGVELDVVNEAGVRCAAGEVGELHHRGALVATGYWQDPEASAKKFYRVGEQRGLRTGDLVRRDADGCLWYVGRSESMIKSSGFRFSPREIEDALCTHEAVREAVVFGVDDAALGQAVEVAVVPADEGASKETLAAVLLAHLRPQLPRYMLPRRFFVIDAIPRRPNFKVDMGALRG